MLGREHRRALQGARSLSFLRVQVPKTPAPCEHHAALQAEQRRLVGALQEHHRVLERVREATEQDRTYYRRALEENRWLIALAERILRRTETRKAA